MPTRSDAGVVYIAFGDRYVDEAVASARSLRQHCPGLPAALMTDEASVIPEGAFDLVQRHPVTHMRAKVDLLPASPFEHTLYLDSDTLVQRDIRDIFATLARFDVAMCHSFTRRRARWARQIPEYAAIPYAFSEFDGGVIAFRRSPAALAFLAEWKRLFECYRDITQGWDQASLRMAAWNSGVQICTLPVEFNVRAQAHRNRVDKLRRSGDDPEVMLPRIIHWHGVHNADALRRRFSAKYRPYRY